MNPFVMVILIAYTLGAAAALVSARKPMTFCLIATAGWLFLPHGTIDLPGLPGLNRATGLGIALLIGALFGRRPRSMRGFCWIDAAAALLALSPFAASVTSGLGAYDGVSAVLVQALIWLAPYVAGRVVLSSPRGLLALLSAIALGAVIYAPLCILELLISPQLHRILYGFHQHSFVQTMRGSGFRPMVFLQHPLATALWMASGVIALLGLRRAITRQASRSMVTLAAVGVFVVAIACKSAGSTVLLIGGVGVFFAATTFGMIWPLLAMAAVLPAFATLRLMGVSIGDYVVQLASGIAPGRALSLQARLDNEAKLLEKATQRLLFGHGSQFHLTDVFGGKQTTADSMWIITLGRQGLLGLLSLCGLLAGPATACYRAAVRLRKARLKREAAVLVATLIIVLLFAIDCVFNAMINPIFVMAAGACVSNRRLGKTLKARPRPRPIQLAAPTTPASR